MTAEIPNPFKAELEATLIAVRPIASRARETLRLVKAAWAVPAWHGGSSDRLDGDLSGWSDYVPAAAEDCIETLERLVACQPDMVTRADAKQHDLRAM